MELTKAQIQKVSRFLESKNFDFIDLKLEVLDHIISDIESLLKKNNTFKNAYKTTTLKWNKHFKETSSFFFGLQYHESKIVVKKAVKIFKPFYLLYMVAYFLPIISLKSNPIKVSENLVTYINGTLLVTSVILFLYMAFIVIKVIQFKVKSTYSFILRTQYMGLVLLILGLFVGLFKEDGVLNPIFTGFVFGGYAVSFICHYFFKKHKEEIRKYEVL